MRSRRIITGFISIAAILVLSSIPAAAQETQKYTGLMIRTPAEYDGFTFEFYMDPGETKCDQFIAQHDFELENVPRTFYTMVSDLELDSITRQPIFPTKRLVLDHQYSLASWITVNKDRVYFPQWGHEEIMEFCVTVPEDASPGSHYAVILLSNLTVEEYLNGVEDTSLTGTQLGTRTGVNVITTVSGAINTDFGVESFEVRDIDMQSALFNIFEILPLNFVANLINEGNQFVKPAGNITIHRGDITKPEETFVFNPSATRVLPESRYSFANLWDSAPIYLERVGQKTIQQETGSENIIYENELRVDLSKLSEFRFGRYFATLQVTFTDVNGDFQRLADYTIEFWVIPWKLILLIIILLAGYIIWRRQQGKRKNK